VGRRHRRGPGGGAPRVSQAVVERPPVPPRDAILTTEQLAEWLQISPEQVRRLGLPAIAVGKRKWRYLMSQVLDELEKRAE